ncbi:hypothetical protein [Pseudomonas syringae]|uniref:Uncharacterized protein n=1 Tax=Pseudomonas syringae pv. syringae TaxID=321 RepID=A0AAE5SAF7_PSESY|nr:hypothetical protein [Pseudomonas syringae]POQ05504.1 hypothetical protein CXB42_05015 [Pseudomonas syringae pv. syringae]
MRYQIGQHGIGGRDESWFYAEYEAETGKAYWVHEWQNMNHNLQVNEGERKIELQEAGSEQYYSNAVAIIREKHPEWSQVEVL